MAEWLGVLLVAILGISATSSELVELSYTFNVDAPNSPKLTSFKHTIIKKGLNKHNVWVELNDFCASEHSGTHIDAPVHFAEKGWPVDKIPTKNLWRVPAVVIDLSETIRKSKQLNYEIKVKDLEDWETVNGVIPDGSLVIIRTGQGDKAGNIRAYSGLDDVNKLNFPGLGVGAAKWLVSHKGKHGYSTGVVGVGIDTISLDVGQSVRFPSHVALMEQNIYGIENLANVNKLPTKGSLVTVLPLRIGGGSGSPARVIAEVNEGECNGGVRAATPITSVTVGALFLLWFFVYKRF